MNTNEGEEIRAKVLRRDEQAARVMALQAVPCVYRPAESVRAGDFLGYALGRLMALREFGRVDWQPIERAAARRGVTWLEFMAVEIVRFGVGRATCVEGDGARARLWRDYLARLFRKWGEPDWLACIWVEISHRAELIIQGKEDRNLVVGGSGGMEKRRRLEPVFSSFVKGESLPPVPAWLMG